MKKTNINLLLAVCALFTASTLFAQSSAGKAVAVSTFKKTTGEAIAEGVAKETTAKVIAEQGIKRSFPVIEKQAFAEAVPASLGKVQPRFPSSVGFTSGAQIPRVRTTDGSKQSVESFGVSGEKIAAKVKSAVSEVQQQAGAGAAKASAGALSKEIVKLTPVEKAVGIKTADVYSYEALSRLKEFYARHGYYPRGKFFEKKGKEITELTFAQQQEKMLFEDLQAVMEKLPNSQYTKEIVALKKEWTEIEGSISETERTLDELSLFVIENKHFPQNHFGEDISQLSGKEEVAVAKESLLREKIDRLMAEQPKDTWVEEMKKLKEEYMD